MPKRGVRGCPHFCTNCNLDCRCQYCGYCHSCAIGSASGRGGHTWSHTCTGTGNNDTGPEESESTAKFLLETSERFSKFFETSIFTLSIGDEKKFYIHEAALSEASAVLKKQITSEMKEATSKEISLKDCTDYGDSFTMFIQYCYFGGYGYDERGKEDALLVHAHVYVLAERLEALGLKQLALQKATILCSDDHLESSGVSKDLLKTLLFVLPETVSIIYSNTYDNNTGKLPSKLVERKGKNVVNIPTIKRDGFRLLLAKFAGAHIVELRGNESFVNALQEYPAFSTDVLLCANQGGRVETDGRGNLLF